MKEKLTKLKECANEIDTRYSEHPLYRILDVPAAFYDEKVTPFKLSLAQMLYVCLWILDLVRRDKCQSSEESDAVFHHLCDVYQQMAPRRCPKKSIAFAALVSLKSACFCLEALVRAYPSEYDVCMVCLQETIDRYGNAYHNDKQKLGDIFKEKQSYEEMLWVLDFLPFLKNYMEEQESIFEEMETWLEKKGVGKAGGESEVVVALKKQIEDLQREKRALEEELEAEKEEEAKGAEQFRIRHIVILFEALLGKRAVTNDMNVSHFATLLSMVSGYGSKSIDNKIPASGLDYQNLRVRKQANEVIKYLEDVSPEMAERIREKMKG